MRATSVIVALLGFTAMSAADPKPSVKSVIAGAGASCAVFSTGKVACWGQVVLENEVTHATPMPIDGLTDVVAMAAEAEICALKAAGTITCWRTGRLRSKADRPVAPISFEELPVKN